VVEIDSCCRASKERYYRNCPNMDRNQPWYHVLVSGTTKVTYPAQSSLIPDEANEDVYHPLIYGFFKVSKNGLFSA
jgi:heat shock protein HspQ